MQASTAPAASQKSRSRRYGSRKMPGARSSGAAARSRSLETKRPATSSAARGISRRTSAKRRQQAHQPLGFAQVAEHPKQESRGSHPQPLAVAQHFGLGRWCVRRQLQVRNLDHPGGRGMLAHHPRRGRVVNHHRARSLRHAPEHGISEVAAVAGRGRPPAPEFVGQPALPFAIVVGELVDVRLARKLAQQEMVQHGVVQHHDSRLRQCPLVDGRVQPVVAQVVERDIAARGVHFHPPVPPQARQQSLCVIRYTGGRGRQRSIETYRHRYTGPLLRFTRFPNSAVPTRTQVEPSSMAASKSCDIPIESPASWCRPANSRSCRK